MNKMWKTAGQLLVISIFGLIFGIILVAHVHAQGIPTTVHVPCTNDNFHTSPYCQGKPVVVDGQFTGQLDTGATWSHTWLTDGVLKMEVERAYWYVIRGEVYWLESDLQAYSIYWYGE